MCFSPSLGWLLLYCWHCWFQPLRLSPCGWGWTRVSNRFPSSIFWWRYCCWPLCSSIAIWEISCFPSERPLGTTLWILFRWASPWGATTPASTSLPIGRFTIGPSGWPGHLLPVFSSPGFHGGAPYAKCCWGCWSSLHLERSFGFRSLALRPLKSLKVGGATKMNLAVCSRPSSSFLGNIRFRDYSMVSLFYCWWVFWSLRWIPPYLY